MNVQIFFIWKVELLDTRSLLIHCEVHSHICIGGFEILHHTCLVYWSMIGFQTSCDVTKSCSHVHILNSDLIQATISTFLSRALSSAPYLQFNHLVAALIYSDLFSTQVIKNVSNFVVCCWAGSVQWVYQSFFTESWRPEILFHYIRHLIHF